MTNFLQNFLLCDEDDEVARQMYEELMRAVTRTPHDVARLEITVRLHFRGRGRDPVNEKLAFHVPDDAFVLVRKLADHYLRTYGTLHVLDDPENTSLMRAHVIVTDELSSISLHADRAERTDEDIRRSKFRDSANAMGLGDPSTTGTLPTTLGNPDTDLDLSDFGPRDPSKYNPFRDQ